MRFIAAGIAVALSALPAAAQIGNGSDVTGPGLTGSGITGGTYEAGGFRRSENAVFRTPNGTALWASGEVACAVTAAVPGVERSLRDGPLTARPEAGGAPVSDAAREALWNVMRADSVDRTAASEALAALLRGSASPRSRLGRRAGTLADALGGLLGKSTPCPPQGGMLNAEPWDDAVQAYDQYLNARPRGEQRSDAVLGVHSVLATFMAAALNAAGGPAR
jgi:hypothetical protein